MKDNPTTAVYQTGGREFYESRGQTARHRRQTAINHDRIYRAEKMVRRLYEMEGAEYIEEMVRSVIHKMTGRDTHEVEFRHSKQQDGEHCLLSHFVQDTLPVGKPYTVYVSLNGILVEMHDHYHGNYTRDYYSFEDYPEAWVLLGIIRTFDNGTAFTEYQEWNVIGPAPSLCSRSH